jgi:hypothetical protein
MKRMLSLIWTVSTLATVTDCGSSSAKHSGANTNGGDGGTAGYGSESSGGNAAGSNDLPHTDDLSLNSVTANIVGIHGDDLAITVKGTQKDVGTLLALDVTLLDSSSRSITFFDTNLDGRADPGSGRLVLDQSPTDTSFTGTGTILNAGRLGTLSQVAVKLVSKSYSASDAVVAKVTKQTLAAEGSSCDPEGVLNRCKEGTGCVGSKPKCQADVVPTIVKASYLALSSGARVIAVGSDPLSPLESIYVEFFDKNNESVGFDTTASGTKDTSFTSSNGITEHLGSFTWYIETTEDFVSTIPRLRLTPMDRQSKTGNATTVNVQDIEVVDDGADCDPRGFDTCKTGSVCWPGQPSTSGTCQRVSSRQTSACTSTTTLNVTTGSLRTAGRFSSTNLWNPPQDCSTASSLLSPDAIVHLSVKNNLSKLIISTKTPETNVATVVYLLDDCHGTSTLERCSDRPFVAPSADAELSLSNVAAGDYYVVLENLDVRYGSYGLTVTAE